MRIREDLSNKIYNRLTVISYVGNDKWNCLCICGNTRIVSTGNLKSNHTKSCGCLGKNRTEDLTNRTFELLFVIKRLKNDKWICKCSCSKELEIIADGKHLKSGRTRSCGCLKIKSLTKHGMHKTKEYSSWQHMKDRCLNSKYRNYKYYGGRGITICNRWIESFQNFIDDMGKMPSGGYSIDRIDVNGNYCPENCKWSTREEQDNNTRNSRFITYDGKTLTIAQWSRLNGISQMTISRRLRRGWSEIDSITIPIKINNKYIEKQGR